MHIQKRHARNLCGKNGTRFDIFHDEFLLVCEWKFGDKSKPNGGVFGGGKGKVFKLRKPRNTA